ncbi:MAG: 50S ribosomal protein L24 [bacterium]|nr:50S ribosomal protein L24 [Candidatus Sumerlaeota bacterium]
MALRIKKNDRVQVITGKYKATVSRVLFVIPKENRAVVEKVNMVKRHMKRRSQTKPGGIIEKEAPIHISNLQLYCDKCKRGSRFGTQLSEDGKEKKRICKRCGATV